MRIFIRKVFETFSKGFQKIIFSDIFWLLLICFTFRNYFDKTIGYISYNADSATYWLAAQNLFKGLIDDYRTPLYPLILKLIECIGGRDTVFENTLVFQHIVSFISIIPFYSLTKKWFKSKPISFATSLVYGCHHSVLQITYGIFAESLLISFLVFFLSFFFRFISNPTTFKWIALHVFMFLMVMLKPICIILYAILVFVGIALFMFDPKFKEKHFPLSKILSGYLVSLLLIIGFCTTNKIQNDYFGVSTVSHDNNFANVILSQAYQEIPDEKLVEIIDTARYYGHYYTIYYLNNDHEKYQKSFSAFPSQYDLSLNMLGVKSIPANNLGYNRKNLTPLVKRAMFSRTQINYIIRDFIMFSNSVMFSIKGFIFYLIIYFELTLILYNLFFNKEIDWMRLFVLFTGAGILFASIFGGINDGTRERVLLPVIPFLIIMFFDLINYSYFATINYVRKRKHTKMDK